MRSLIDECFGFNINNSCRDQLSYKWFLHAERETESAKRKWKRIRIIICKLNSQMKCAVHMKWFIAQFWTPGSWQILCETINERINEQNRYHAVQYFTRNWSAPLLDQCTAAHFPAFSCDAIAYKRIRISFYCAMDARECKQFNLNQLMAYSEERDKKATCSNEWSTKMHWQFNTFPSE